MAFIDKIVLNAIERVVEESIGAIVEEKEMLEAKNLEYEKQKREDARAGNVDRKREDTPCRFNEGITEEEFLKIANDVANRIKRIKRINVYGAFIICTVESMSGCSEWDFWVDFNDWGHVTGTYWRNADNCDSNIPTRYGRTVSRIIQQILEERDICFPDYSGVVDENKELETPNGLIFHSPKGILKKLLAGDNRITSKYDSLDLVGEHVYVVVSFLKNNGYRNVKSMLIRDIDDNSDKYPYEVEQIVINGTSYFEVGDFFPSNAEVYVLYHMKREIAMPYAQSYFKRKNYIDVGDELAAIGFTNIYERKIKDLTTGFMIKNGAVDQVLMCENDKEVEMNKNRLYEYDTQIIITYHTYK